nr:MAG TPA: hypothetical protein [Caudoviricetes sp.]
MIAFFFWFLAILVHLNTSLFFMILLYLLFSILSMFFFIILEIFFNKLLTCTVHMVIYKHKQQNKHSHRRCEV